MEANAAQQTKRLLVIGQNPRLAQIARLAANDLVVEYAVSESEGRRKLREIRPDIIIVGDLDPPGTVSRLSSDLREGWISHHAALVVVELDTFAHAYRIVSDFAHPAGPMLPDESLVSELKKVLIQKLKEKENRFKNALVDPGGFCLVWEQIPGPGAFELRQELALDNARRAARSGAIAAISVTDNPGGNPAIATDVLCAEILKAGIEPLVHISFRDRGRNQAESLLFQLAALGIHNLLILTGDYPSNLGFTGKSKPVFDLDSVNALSLVAEMNRGLEREIMRKPVRLTATNFFAGVAFSPFKQMEAEVMGQFYKMKQKIGSGADFAITQVGYDARKLHEFYAWLEAQKHPIPALAGIYVLSYPVAKAMHENHIPGCVVTDKLLAEIAAESAGKDKGRQARLDRAAKMFAIAKGMGYKGAYISGQGLPFESVEYIVGKGNELAGQWLDLVGQFDYPQQNGFYYFERDQETGLNTGTRARKTQKPGRPLIFRLSQAIHRLAFDPRGPFFRPMRRFMKFVDSSRPAYEALHFFERCGKNALYCCKDCGDCALFNTAYLCPVSQCPKDQRNAPCGGSFQGWCEVYPGKKLCIWVLAYLRLKALGAEEEIGKHTVPPCNWDLWQTSSWVNYFLGRDHSSKQRGIQPPT
jgi:methylenetetrahydrofolate reductase (NADPH)